MRGVRGACRLGLSTEHAHEDDDLVEPFVRRCRLGLLQPGDLRALPGEPGLVDAVATEHAPVLADDTGARRMDRATISIPHG